MTAAATLRAMGACPAALEWARDHGGSLAELWAACPRGDWLLWYAGKAGASRVELVRAATGCAELALPYAGTGRKACEAAIAAARAWADAPGEGTGRVVERAADAAYTATHAAYTATHATYAAADAARVAADAARVAYATDATYAAYAANAAAKAADAAYAAMYAADAAGAVGAGGKMHAACADVVRACVPFVEVMP